MTFILGCKPRAWGAYTCYSPFRELMMLLAPSWKHGLGLEISIEIVMSILMILATLKAIYK